MSRRCPGRCRRGTAAVSVIIALVLLQLVIVVVVVAGARDQNLTVHRVATARAFYASEAGLQMGLRELMLKADEDGDGTVGTISNDGIAGNDPVIDGAQVFVSAQDQLLISAGRSQESRRNQAVEIASGNWFGGASSSTPMHMTYGRWPTSTPWYSLWRVDDWSRKQVPHPFGSRLHWAGLVQSPVRNEVIMAYSTGTSNLRAITGTTEVWPNANIVVATTSLASLGTRPFAVEYEQSSGRAMLAYGVGNNPALFYRIWNGAAWSTQFSTSTPLTSQITFVRLIPRARSNQIMVLVSDSSGNLAGVLWNGSAFQDMTLLESSLPAANCESADGAWESEAGRCVVVWGTASGNYPRTAAWNGDWTPMTNLQALGGEARWVRVKADPSSDQVMLAVLDSAGRINAAVSDGTVWSGFSLIEAAAATIDSRCFDFDYQRPGGRAIIVYGRGGNPTPAYRVFDGSWGSPQNCPAMASSPAIVQCRAHTTNGQLFVGVCLSGSSALKTFNWTGTAFGPVQHIEDDISGGNNSEAFMIMPPLVGGSATRVRGWSELEP